MVGGRAYIASLSSGTPTTSNATEYAKIVVESAAIRRLISTADDIVTKGYESSMDAGQMLDYAERGIFENIPVQAEGTVRPHQEDVLLENIEIIDKSISDGRRTYRHNHRF